MNSTFRAYLLPERPKLKTQKHRVTMERKIRDLEDDMKEYWGFYLLKDSFFRVSFCSRHEGASVVIIKHSKNVERCAWLGELDSAEESDEISNEFDFKTEVLDEAFKDRMVTLSSEISAEISREDTMSANSKELQGTLQSIDLWSQGSKTKLVKHLLEQMLDNTEGSAQGEKQLQLGLQAIHTQQENVRAVTAQGHTGAQIQGGDDDAKETFDSNEGDVDHLFNQGKFNQKNTQTNKKDTSNEETRSSWGSSEEALAACEGAIVNVALDGATRCNDNSTFAEMMPFMTNISHEVDFTGFYYFIFTNENEITDNFVAANIELLKTVFDVSHSTEECNSTECNIPLSFMSNEHVVLEVPRQDSEMCEYEHEGVTNYHQCNNVVTAESICEPRGTVYMTFLLLVPFFILMFSYV